MTSEEILGKIAEAQTLRSHLLDTAAQCDAANISDAAPSGAYDEEIKTAIYLKSLRRECSRTAAKIDETIKVLQIQAKANPLVEHIVQQNDTPERLSIKYYGTPHDWPKILQKNKKTSPDLTVGEKLIIPQ